MTKETYYTVNKKINTKLGRILLVKFLGKGKSGYSYLGTLNKSEYTVKLMHDEPFPMYPFGDRNKVEIELESYKILNSIGIPLPKLRTYDMEKGFLVKDYIDGILATEIIARGDSEKVIKQLFNMSEKAKSAEINLDYYPANFVLKDNILYYIDYEHNEYHAEWDLINWGLYYWANKDGMRKYLETGNILFLNEKDSPKPIKEPNKELVRKWIYQYKQIASNQCS